MHLASRSLILSLGTLVGITACGGNGSSNTSSGTGTAGTAGTTTSTSNTGTVTLTTTTQGTSTTQGTGTSTQGTGTATQGTGTSTTQGTGTSTTQGTSATQGTSTGPATSTGTGTGTSSGTTGGMMNGQAAYFWGDFDTAMAYEAGVVDNSGTASALSLMGFEGQTDIRSVAVSPDGMSIAVSGTNMAGDSAVINVYAADGSGAPVTAADASTSANPTGAWFSRIQWSPDGTMLAFTADLGTDNAYRAYVVPADGSSDPVLVSQDPANANQDVAYIVWVDDTHVAFNGDTGSTNNLDEIYGVDIGVAVPSPVELAPSASMTTSQDTNTSLVPGVDSMGRVYFVGDWEAANQHFRVYRNTVDGANLEQVPGTSIMVNAAEASAGTYGLSQDGSTLAFSVETDTGLFNVYVMDLSGTSSSDVSGFTMPPASGSTGPNSNTNMFFSPDGSLIAVRADWPDTVNGDFAMYVVTADGTAAPVRIAMPTAGGDAVEAAWSPDGSWLFFRGDMVTAGTTELFGTTDVTTADQNLGGITVQSAAGNIFGLAAAR